jgi:hypothetical protein
MKEEDLQQIVAEVIRRLALRLGADGSRGMVIAVFTGATAEFNESIQQVRYLILTGYSVQLVFSQAAENLFAQAVRDQLAGFPHVGSVKPSEWLSDLKESHAVVVPLLSVNTVSKLSMLIADSLINNLILHALFMGKPVIAARNGTDPTGRGREELGFHKGTPALRQALAERLQILTAYGCHLCDVKDLKNTLNDHLTGSKYAMALTPDQPSDPSRSTLNHSGKLVTAADIRHAHRLGANLSISPSTLMTPLARDLAMHYGVALTESNER